MSNEQIIMTLFGLLLAAYGFIFKGVLDRIKKMENKNCDPNSCYKRFDKIEERQDQLMPAINKLQETMSKVEAFLEILMQDYNNRRK